MLWVRRKNSRKQTEDKQQLINDNSDSKVDFIVIFECPRAEMVSDQVVLLHSK